MALTSIRLHVVERDLKTVAASVLVFKLTPTCFLLGGSQDQQVGPTQAPFQITASALGTGACEISCAHESLYSTALWLSPESKPCWQP